MARLKITSPVRHSGALYMPGAIAPIDDDAVVNELIKLGVAELEEEPEPEPKVAPKAHKAKAEKVEAEKPAE